MIFNIGERFVQESLLNTVKNAQKEQRVNIEELEYILGSSIAQIVTFCKKAHLKPKTDANGSAYFTKEDVATLRKVKEFKEYVYILFQREENLQYFLLATVEFYYLFI